MGYNNRLMMAMHFNLSMLSKGKWVMAKRALYPTLTDNDLCVRVYLIR